MLTRFLQNKSGNYGMTMGILSLPLLLSVGFGIDYSRHVAAKSHLQQIVDSAALALASSNEKDDAKLEIMAEKYIAANASTGRVSAVAIETFKTQNDQIDLGLKGSIDTIFMGLANIDTLEVRASALSERAVTGSVEVALVLDNTWSMSEKDAKGTTKIATLKEAAGGLVSELMNNSKAVVSIGLVPYADYINVGLQYRNEPWLSIPPDKTVQPNPRVCTKKTTKSVCPSGATAPKYACTKYVDGVAEPAQCGGGCTKPLETITVPEYETCSGGGNPTNYTWHGCIGSRKQGKTRLDDLSPKFPYPGYVETSQKCLNPIVPLIKDKAKLLAAINGMIINVGNYKPYTYIPAGLIWGQNILSSSEPFSQGSAYDPDNQSPRKVVVLMTDGDNTLRFNPGDGRHSALNSNAATAKVQVGATNDDTATICEYMKSNKIEIFTVAFMVDNDDAKTLLQGCATDKDHYYDASDSEKLAAAFSGIAQSLTHVRLAR